MTVSPSSLRLGWAQVDITPAEPVLVAGQFYARISERICDPLMATILAIETNDNQAVLVGCDLCVIPPEFLQQVRKQVRDRVPDLNTDMILMNATHIHTGPEIRLPDPESGTTASHPGVDLPVMPVEKCAEQIRDKIANAIVDAWKKRDAGSVAFGQGVAVVGRNRRAVYATGESAMYGDTTRPDFRHIEGYEDHSLNLLAVWDGKQNLSGLVVNIPSPSQVSEQEFALSADYWHETRQELRQRFGESIFILPQCSAAGDQSPHLLYEKAAEQRMLKLKNRSKRQEIACRIADAVADTLPFLEAARESKLCLHHRVDRIKLPLNTIPAEAVAAAEKAAAECQRAYEAELKKLKENPALKEQPRWYMTVTAQCRRAKWYQGVSIRYQKQQKCPEKEFEVHTLRLGDMAMASSPFEYYLDYGIRIKARSPAIQTFLVQLAGGGTYVPSERSLQGGGYGSLPASNPIGPRGGQILEDQIHQNLQELWADEKKTP